MLYSLTLSHESLKVVEQQFRASVEPDLRLLPNVNSPMPYNINMAAKPGVFNYTVKNAGADDLQEIYIYVDYFAVFWSPTNALQLQLVSPGFVYFPKPSFEYLAHGSGTNYTINMTNYLSQFKTYKSSPICRGIVARIRIDYHRTSDGHKFSNTKALMLGGDFDMLSDESDSAHGLPWQFPQFTPYDDIKRILGGQ
jgi:hypothetical protein